ncbi:hypothetical protein H5410_041113, partial [Solanum commersonii]
MSSNDPPLKESMDTTLQKGTKRLKRTIKRRLEDHRVHLDQVGGKKDQSAHHREVPQSSIISPNNPENDDAKGWCKTAMNYTKERIADLISILTN